MHSDRSHHSVGLPHSEIRGSQPSYRLLSAYRRFSRPSSPLNAKASITCPFSLGHAYLTPCGAGHATFGLCGSERSHARLTAHARRRPESRDRSRCSILRGQSRLAPGLAACCGARVCRARPTLHLSKTPARLGQTGIGNGTEMPEAVKGVSGVTEQEFEADFLLAETLVMSRAPCPAEFTSCRRCSPQRPMTPRLARAAWPDRGRRCPRPGCGSRGRDGCWRR